MTQRPPMTVQGVERLRKELDHLKRVVRPKITEAIAEARAHGDLKENAEYHAAREQQGMTEARIKQLEGGISNAQVIDTSKLNVGDKVVFGAQVTLADLETDAEVKYHIVGDLESDISKGLLSVNSPVARAIIGKSVGDEISVHAPAGDIAYEIVDVHYS